MLNLKQFSDDGEGSPRFDISLAEDDQALESNVILSLFLDRRANPEEVDDGADLRGFWGDAFNEGDQTGSKLWTLRRAKVTPDVLRAARDYALQSLKWMKDDKVASRIEVEAQRAGTYTLHLSVTIHRPDGGLYQRTWQNLIFK